MSISICNLYKSMSHDKCLKYPFSSGVECSCHQPSVENGVVNRVQVGKGCNYRYTVTCNSGYEAFGPVTYECGSTGMTPRFATRCIPEGSCKWKNNTT